MTTTTILPGPKALAGERAVTRLARKITGRPYLSHSQLSTMRACPRKFAFEYVEKAPKDFIASSLLFGGAVHAALELHFRCRMEGLTATRSALWNHFHEGYRRQREEAGSGLAVRFNKGEDANTLSDLAARMLDVFLGSAVSEPAGKILGIEEQLTVTLAEDLPDLLARVDLVWEGDAALHITDFKTARAKWNEQKVVESAGQLTLYGRMAADMSQGLGLPVKLQFAIITKQKTPQIQVLDVPGEESRLDAVREGVTQVWEAIQTGNFYPAPSPQNCSTCPFKSRCPVFARK